MFVIVCSVLLKLVLLSLTWICWLCNVWISEKPWDDPLRFDSALSGKTPLTYWSATAFESQDWLLVFNAQSTMTVISGWRVSRSFYIYIHVLKRSMCFCGCRIQNPPSKNFYPLFNNHKLDKELRLLVHQNFLEFCNPEGEVFVGPSVALYSQGGVISQGFRWYQGKVHSRFRETHIRSVKKICRSVGTYQNLVTKSVFGSRLHPIDF